MWLTIRYGAKEFKVEIDVGGVGTTDDSHQPHQEQTAEDGEGKTAEQNSEKRTPTTANEEAKDDGGDDGDGETAKASSEVKQQKMPKNLGELRQRICAETGYDNGTMKLIHKGKYIVTALDQPLAELNFKEGDKIVAMGSAAMPKPTMGLELLSNYEKMHLVKLSELFKINGDDIAELERNFLEDHMLEQMLKRMDKRLKEFTETALRHLESIDALNIYPDDATEEEKCRCREKRKCMVDGIQKLLNENDKYVFQLQQYRKSLLYK